MIDLPGRKTSDDERVAKLFACSCGAERTLVWDEVLAEVVAEISPHGEGFIATAVVYRLIHFCASITAILADQWARIETETWDKTFATKVDCDRIEHGLAATWRLYMERFPEGHYTPVDEDDEDDEE